METIVVDCLTGEQTRVPLTEEEIAAVNAMRADNAAREAEPSKNELLGLMLEDVVPGEEDTTVLWLVMQEMLRP